MLKYNEKITVHSLEKSIPKIAGRHNTKGLVYGVSYRSSLVDVIYVHSPKIYFEIF